jgi:hypothetical protein
MSQARREDAAHELRLQQWTIFPVGGMQIVLFESGDLFDMGMTKLLDDRSPVFVGWCSVVCDGPPCEATLFQIISSFSNLPPPLSA